MNTHPSTQRKTVYVEELAEQLGRSKNWVYNQCRRGAIPGAKQVGKIWLIPRDTADKLLSGEGGTP